MEEAGEITNAQEQDPSEFGVKTLPRIIVEIFCITSEFASTIQMAGKDRRMSRAKISVGMGDINKAIHRYENKNTPHLVIIEYAGSVEEMLDDLERFANVCGKNTKVIIAGNNNDIETYRRLLNKGVSEYIVLPTVASKVIDRMCDVYSDPDSAPAARMIGFMGVKGGTGSSTLSHNFAKILSTNTSKETILIDFDIEFGTAALNFNLEAKKGIVDALADITKLDDTKIKRLLYEYSENFKLLASPATFVDDIDTSKESILTLIDAIKQSCEICIMDIPSSWNSVSKTVLLNADDTVLVATPDIVCLRNLKTMYDTLKQQRPNDPPPKIIINQTELPNRPEIAIKDFSDVIGVSIDLVIPFDANLFGKSINNGYLLEEISPNHEVVTLIRDFGRSFYRFEGGKAASHKDANVQQKEKSLIKSLVNNFKGKK